MPERGQRVAAGCDGLALDARDRAQGGCRRPERAQETGERGGGHLVAGVGEQAAEADTDDASVPQHMQRASLGVSHVIAANANPAPAASSPTARLPTALRSDS